MMSSKSIWKYTIWKMYAWVQIFRDMFIYLKDILTRRKRESCLLVFFLLPPTPK